jgi:protein-S-isoprenylcysteine O-methyltransferase Ste14
MLVNFFIIPGEEGFLTKMLGDDFIEYKNNVRKWI